MLLLGIDVGTSAIKVSVVDAATQKAVASAQFPETESPILALQTGWAEQDPLQWWKDVQQCIFQCHASGRYDPKQIAAIGISYQMHGLVIVDKNGSPLRHSIIWCDSRAVPYGQAASEKMGEQTCLETLLNSPGNFTAAKLAWVKENEPGLFEKVHKVMLPGDFIAYQFTGQFTTTPAALSEGILWNFSKNTIAKSVMDCFGFDASIIPDVQAVFSSHGALKKDLANTLNLTAGIPVSYKAGDQPNNALSLNVMKPGEVATTAGTSGVIYGVAETVLPDQQSRLNCFAHVNHTMAQQRIGLLLCINGCGIMNKMARQWMAPNLSYAAINEMAAGIAPGSEGISVLPFGNGAERMLNNQLIGAHLLHLDLNRHCTAHLMRATQEGIAFSFRYGFDIMRSMGMQPAMIRAGYANLFLSPVFVDAFVNITNTPVELYHTDGATGAALGAGIGAGFFTENDLGKGLEKKAVIEPIQQNPYEEAYAKWLQALLQLMQS